MSRYVINILASRELTEIAEYFAQTNLEAGEGFFREFNRKCQQLTAFPNSGKSYAEIRPDLRGLPLEGYIAKPKLMRYCPHPQPLSQVGEGRRKRTS